jgi:titin
VITFTAPADGGSGITGYTVTASPGGAVLACSASPCVFTGLTNGSSYTFNVHATNAVGNSAESSSSAAVVPAGVPDAPVIGPAVPGDRSTVITFMAPASHGSAIFGYEVSTDGGVTWAAVSTTGVSPLTAALGGLSNGHTYVVELRAVNGAGVGPASSGTAVVPVAVPDGVGAVTVVAGDGTATLTFATPFDNGSPITSYSVTVSPGGQVVSCTAGPCVITGLINGGTYTFAVAAVNTVGAGVSSTSVPVMPAGPPSAAPAGSVTVADGQATVNWSAPTDLNGATITGYTVTASPGGGTCTPVPVTATSCVIGDLVPGLTYTYSIVAHSTAGDSPVGVADESITAPSSPAAASGSAPASSGSGAVPGELAFTGTDSSDPLELGLGALLLGMSLVEISRRRRRSAGRHAA